MPKRNSDVRRRRSDRSRVLDVRDRIKYGPRYGIPLHRKGRGGQGLVPSFYDRNRGSYKRMNGVGKGSSCYVGAKELCFFRCYLQGSSLNDTVRSYQRFVIGNSFRMKGLDGGPIIRGGQNTVRQIRSNTMEKPRLKFFFLSLPEGQVTKLWEGL